jgi:hypothetical protein
MAVVSGFPHDVPQIGLDAIDGATAAPAPRHVSDEAAGSIRIDDGDAVTRWVTVGTGSRPGDVGGRFIDGALDSPPPAFGRPLKAAR